MKRKIEMSTTAKTSFARRYRVPILLALLIAAVALWWLFRPERLFVNQHVSEAAPAAITDAQPVFTGSLHGAAANGELHGRVNVLKQGSGLVLTISGLEMKRNGEIGVYLTEGPVEGAAAVSHARKIVSLVMGKTAVQAPIPSGVDPATSKHVLLVDEASGRILATADLEAF